ncbi:hypothetical protein BC628DRAFT_554077 [Trametes gibbosa]|nr:hypothetical protein BC628DRAFT_554077 [Trametes gibbosa]
MTLGGLVLTVRAKTGQRHAYDGAGSSAIRTPIAQSLGPAVDTAADTRYIPTQWIQNTATDGMEVVLSGGRSSMGYVAILGICTRYAQQHAFGVSTVTAPGTISIPGFTWWCGLRESLALFLRGTRTLMRSRRTAEESLTSGYLVMTRLKNRNKR